MLQEAVIKAVLKHSAITTEFEDRKEKENMFGDLFKKKEEAKPVTQEELVHKVNLSKEKVKVSLKKQNVSATKARVVFALDHSGSLGWAYRNGTIQNVTERIFPIAMEMDDNSELDFMLFDDGYKNLDVVTIDNLNGYVKNVVDKKGGSFGGTSYAPVMEAITEKYGRKEKSDIPTFVIFITDGDNGDKKKAEKAMIEASKYNIFWKFIGIGKAGFSFLEKLDDMAGRTVDNADFITVADLNVISDEALYDRIFNEYNGWLTACKEKGI